MKKLIIFLCVSTFLFSCTSNTIYKKPKDLIPKDTMILILKDLHLATTAKSSKNKKNYRKVSYIPLVYSKYKIDSLRFKNSSLYYTSKVDEYQPMLKEVLAQLEEQQSIVAKLKKVRDSVTQDSIRASKGLLFKKGQRTKKDKKVPNLKKPEKK
ncbi:MAG: DUF4296 domain-containing protein [Flavobacteriaceae bacterium]